MGFTSSFGRTNIGFTANESDLDYENSDLERTWRLATLGFSRQLGARLTGRLEVNYGEFETEGAGLSGDDSDARALLGFGYSFSPRTTVGLSAEYYERDIDNGVIDDDLYGYSIIFLFNYVLLE